MKDYKSEIENSRVGCLGSSDGAMLARIANGGYVPQSAMKRLAVVKGLIPNRNIPQTAAVRAGDEIEMAIYEHLKQTNNAIQSNPLWVSEKYSREHVKLISHPDIVFEDLQNRTLYVYEVKTTKATIDETRYTYKAQLYIHNLIAHERAEKNGRGWKVRLFLVHYDTNGLDLEAGCPFDVSRLTVRDVRQKADLFDIDRAMDLVNDAIANMEEYYDDEVDADYLPPIVKAEFDAMTKILQEIKEREQKVDEFKARLYSFLKEKNIKSIKNDVFSITRVDDTESVGFDAKRFLEDYAAKHKKLYKKLLKDYEKITKRKGYALIKLHHK